VIKAIAGSGIKLNNGSNVIRIHQRAMYMAEYKQIFSETTKEKINKEVEEE